MLTHHPPKPLNFTKLKHGRVVAEFDGGHMASDGGALLSREVNERFDLISSLAECFTDYRAPSRIEHGVEAPLIQRLFVLCLGYKDFNECLPKKPFCEVLKVLRLALG